MGNGARNLNEEAADAIMRGHIRRSMEANEAWQELLAGVFCPIPQPAKMPVTPPVSQKPVR